MAVKFDWFSAKLGLVCFFEFMSERKKKFSLSEVIPNGITSEEKKNSSVVKRCLWQWAKFWVVSWL